MMLSMLTSVNHVLVSWVRVARSFVLLLSVFVLFFFCHWVVCPSICGFWLPLYLVSSNSSCGSHTRNI